MKKWLFAVVVLVALLALGTVLQAFAQDQPRDWVTDKCQYPEVKVAQVPLPWQFWAVTTDPDTGVTTLIDKIRISPTWLNPPTGLPAGTGPILVQRWFVLLAEPLPLERLRWDEIGPPNTKIPWERVDPEPMEVELDQDLELDISLPATNGTGAVIVGYEVTTDTGTTDHPGHFLNEAVLGSPDIIEVRVNLDVHVGTPGPVTDFELDFNGLRFGPDDVIWAIGFDVGTGHIWGANSSYPLLVRPIPGGTEVKWLQPDWPLWPSSTLHIGMAFKLPGLVSGDIGGVRATVQGYWTVVGPRVWCEESVNPHGKTTPPAGWTTLPGAKGGQNEDGFYKLRVGPDPVTYIDASGNVIPRIVKGIYVSGLGPFKDGDVVKITQAPGVAAPSMKPIGSSKGQAGAVVAHITVPSDPVCQVRVWDPAWNKEFTFTCCCGCLVPPPPK